MSITNNTSNALEQKPRTFKLYTKRQPTKNIILKEFISYCEKCGNKYTSKDIIKIREDTHKISYMFKCGKCGHSTIVQLVRPDKTITNVNIILDYPPQQLLQLLKKKPITDFQVLTIYTHVENARTLQDLISPPAKPQEKQSK